MRAHTVNKSCVSLCSAGRLPGESWLNRCPLPSHRHAHSLTLHAARSLPLLICKWNYFRNFGLQFFYSVISFFIFWAFWRASHFVKGRRFMVHFLEVNVYHLGLKMPVDFVWPQTPFHHRYFCVLSAVVEIYIYTHTHTHTHTHTYTYIHTHTYTYIYTHTHTHTYIHIYVNTYAWISWSHERASQNRTEQVSICVYIAYTFFQWPIVSLD